MGATLGRVHNKTTSEWAVLIERVFPSSPCVAQCLSVYQEKQKSAKLLVFFPRVFRHNELLPLDLLALICWIVSWLTRLSLTAYFSLSLMSHFPPLCSHWPDVLRVVDHSWYRWEAVEKGNPWGNISYWRFPLHIFLLNKSELKLFWCGRLAH